MNALLQYESSAARKLMEQSLFDALEPKLIAARDETFADLETLRSGAAIDEAKKPLDAGFIDLPRRLLDEYAEFQSESLVGRILAVAESLRAEIDRVVLLGIGGSYMGARALFEALVHPYHNQLPRAMRDGVPKLSFEGNNLDNDATRGLLELLSTANPASGDVDDRWGIVVISKSGGTLETAVAFRLFREALEKCYGKDSDESRRFIVPITGEAGRLRDLANDAKYPNVFPIPDDVGGRFSIFTAVGLLPAALLGIDIVKLLSGAAQITDRLRDAPLGDNPVLDYTATAHLMEANYGRNIRVLSTWGSRLEAVGLWYDQLLSESLGKHERGATPITAVNTRDLHSRGQQHQEGTLDKLITNVVVEEPSSEPLAVPAFDDDFDQLNKRAGKTLPELLEAAIEGTNRAYADAKRPTADIRLPVLNEFALGQLLQMLMLATVVEGRLIGINPYGQPGVEAYKNNMTEILDRAP